MPTASSSSPTSPRRAAGPRKGERREQAILDATERLLATTPFADLTIDDIARGAGISRSALYFYFASKEQVLTALHRRTYDEMVGTMQPLDDAGVPVADAMLQAIERVCAIWRARRLRPLRSTSSFVIALWCRAGLWIATASRAVRKKAACICAI